MGDILGLIPCRGGSKGIRRKNIQPVAGEPLLSHTVRASLDADAIDRTVVSTDDAEIAEAAREADADVPFDRPDELATDEAPVEPVIEHAIEQLSGEYETLVLLQATSPLRTGADIDAAMRQYYEDDADSLVAVSEDHSYRWRETPEGAERLNYDSRKRRQEKDPEYVESGALYAVDVARFLETGDLQIGRTALYVLDEISALDIDRPYELWLADKILREWRQ